MRNRNLVWYDGKRQKWALPVFCERIGAEGDRGHQFLPGWLYAAWIVQTAAGMVAGQLQAGSICARFAKNSLCICSTTD